MPTFSTENITQLSREGDGTIMGQTALDPIGFFGATPVVQQTLSAAGTDATTVQAAVNSIRTALINLGLGA